MPHYLDPPDPKDISYRKFLKDMDLEHAPLRFLAFSNFFRTEIKFPSFPSEWSLSEGHKSLFFFYGDDLGNLDVIYYWIRHKEIKIHILKLDCGDDCDGLCNNRLYMSTPPKKLFIESRTKNDGEEFYNLRIDNGFRSLICSRSYAMQIETWFLEKFPDVELQTDHG